MTTFELVFGTLVIIGIGILIWGILKKGWFRVKCENCKSILQKRTYDMPLGNPVSRLWCPKCEKEADEYRIE